MDVALLGTGLIGGSIGLALTRAGMRVVGFDADPATAGRAVELGAVSVAATTLDAAVADAAVVVVAVPVGRVAELAVAALDAGAPAVTDVGSAKSRIVAEVRAARPDAAARFVGGHPMAGSEQVGLDGADGELFAGATWVLTPTTDTDVDAFVAVRAVVARLGADIVEVSPERHDALVAMVSHVPQLAATTLMNVADTRNDEHELLLRLAAGGFRDMTRIAAGNPGIWPDICTSNRDAILDALDEYRASLDSVRDLVASEDASGLLRVLETGREARRNLPTGARARGPLSELRIPVQDRPGEIETITGLAAGVNIVDLETAHSIEGDRGVLVLLVPTAGAPGFEARLTAAGYHVSRSDLS